MEQDRQAELSKLVTAARVITSLQPLNVITDGAVGIRDGRIDWVGPIAETRRGDYSQVIRVGGAVLPGLVDAHVHLCFDAGQEKPDGPLLGNNPEQLRQVILRNGSRLLASGVTSVRDLGSRAGSVLSVGTDIAHGRVTGPTVVAADQPLTRRRGHAWSYGMEIGSTAEATASVRLLAARGVGVVKVMITGGRMTLGTDPEAVEFPPTLLRAVVDTAHAEQLPVAAHCLSAAGIRAALTAGVDTLEHCTFIDLGGQACSEGDAVRLADAIADAGAYVCPTINVHYPGRHPISFEQRLHWVRLLHRAGVRLIVGNDIGIPGLPPELYLGALLALEAAGMSRPEVLHAATALPAQAMGVERSVGTLRPGARADLVGVSGDPLSDLETLRKPTVVVARGRCVVDVERPGVVDFPVGRLDC